MNILPKKRWHVRTRENVARVRRDEAKAKEEEQALKERTQLAEREARRQLLLQKSRSKFSTQDFLSLDPNAASNTSFAATTSSSEHVNIFKELEEGVAELKQTNKEHDKEVKEEKEKYEKQIGYLTYLGQDTNEALGKKSWYEEAPVRDGEGEVNLKSKKREDPLMLIKKLSEQHEKAREKCKTNEKYKEYQSVLVHHSEGRKRKRHDNEDKYKKKKKQKKSEKNFESEDNDYDQRMRQAEKNKQLQVLRVERLQRERQEQMRTEQLLAKIKGTASECKKDLPASNNRKYNSQFNPELAKQNYSKY
ncbi:leukocyte receptor cluster member 1 homolog [Euwallacea fornicatus]|uniref:leukocyte receptor cluster member 1 homolog n=1 Tax=Euwallacea fornicatus TaxID=995702 RepID=UPI00338E4B2D